jgi:phenylacetate-coenzyme A ligase PaaK-like adenylate-forming protein
MATKTSQKTGTEVMSEEVRQRLQPVIPPKDQWTPVDEALYGVENLYRVDSEEAQKLRFKAIRYSFKHHYEKNEFYRRYCQTDHISPSDIKEPSDLIKIPFIPDAFFKDHPSGEGFVAWLRKISTGKVPEVRLKNNPSFQDVMEALEEQEYTVTFTSGTSGRFSFFPRNRLTWMRQKYSIACCTMEILGRTLDSQRIGMQFAPNPSKTFLFIGRGTSAVHESLFVKENVHYIINNKITPDSIRISKGMTHGLREKLIARVTDYARKGIMNKFVEQLETFASQDKRMVLGGSPSLIMATINLLEKKGNRLKIGDDTIIMTAGGWKMVTGAPMSDKEFRARLKEAWGVPDENCRDIYGMSECSGLFPDCEGHYKHIPQTFVYPMVLGDDLKPLGFGQYGRFAFLDALPDSYPGFIVTGDRVRMLESCPVCDRIGPVIESDISRMKGSDDRGCSAVMGQLMASGMAKQNRR